MVIRVWSCNNCGGEAFRLLNVDGVVKIVCECEAVFELADLSCPLDCSAKVMLETGDVLQYDGDSIVIKAKSKEGKK